MPVCIVYCTATGVNLQLFKHLEKICGSPELTQAPGLPPPWPQFAPARNRAMTEAKDVDDPDEPEVFENWTIAQCEKLYVTKHESEKWAAHHLFAILDKRSLEDKTIVMHTRKIGGHNRDSKGEVWESWRVRFEDSFLIIVGTTVSIGLYERTFSHAGRFTKDGIFSAQTALDTIDREEREARAAARRNGNAASSTNHAHS